MKTTIYWARQYSCRAMHEYRFRAICWWLNRQVEFLEWRMRQTASMPAEEPKPVPASVGQGGRYVVHSM